MTPAAIVATALFSFAISPATSADAFGTRDEISSLTGVFASTAPEPWYGGYGTRRFTFENGKWSLVFIHALDPAMEKRTFQFRTEGPFEIGTASPRVTGAFEAIFYEDTKQVTLLTQDEAIVRAFGFADCGLRYGVEVDVSVTGCAGWKPVSVCREDHDLLAKSGEDLFFGVRPRDNDMCTPDKRPTALLPAVRRQ